MPAVNSDITLTQ